MIDIAASLLKDELNAYLNLNPDFPDDLVILGNIANLGEPDVALEDKIVITNVVIEEESSLKNKRHFERSATSSVDYIEPPVYLNLYFLFSATFLKNSADGYENSLKRISAVIQFFQTKSQFTVNNSPFSSVSTGDALTPNQKAEINLRVELYTLTFEQINHLWGSLGGKQSPSVMYKVRMVKIQERLLQEAPLIEEIHEHGKAI